MSIKMTGRYLGNLQVELCHEDSGALITTVAPKDNNGDGSRFSPTDIFSGSLGSCMLTIMSIVAARDNVSLEGSYFELTKEMSQNPRRVGKLTVNFHLPAHLSVEYRAKLERSAHTCPVHHSLHPDIVCEISFQYDL